MRADVYLTKNSYAHSRTQAKQLIEAGCVKIGGNPVKKASEEINDAEDPEVELLGDVCRYVSRGGLKLEAALDAFGIDVSGVVAIDIGASTGGFTDCLLCRGASRVVALENGSGQLAEKLISDSRVINVENFNARKLRREDFGTFDIAVTDVSFISQRLLYPNIAAILSNGGRFVSLIKPQFEAGREAVGKNGIVRAKKDHIIAIESCVGEALEYSLVCVALIPSPITGGDGNREYLAYFLLDNEGLIRDRLVGRKIIEATVGQL